MRYYKRFGFFPKNLPKIGHHGHPSSHHPAMAAAVAAAGLHPDTDTDPRELEAFAERFKQRRIKLGSYLYDIILHITLSTFCMLPHFNHVNLKVVVV